MATRIITDYCDEEFNTIEEVFYSNFSPDDWDYIIVGDNAYTVDEIALKLKGNLATDYQVKEFSGSFIAVIYHS
jgi:hypothetical protein